MVRNRKSARRLISTLGTALVAVFAFSVVGAGAAQASPVWHMNGHTMSELGIVSEGFTAKGSFQMNVPDLNFKITCEENSNGNILAPNKLEEQLSLTGCQVAGSPKCVVQPMSIPLTGTGDEVHTGTGTFTTLRISKCAGATEQAIGDPGLTLKYGPEAVNLAVTSSGVGTFGGNTMYFSGSSTWTTSGKRVLGYW